MKKEIDLEQYIENLKIGDMVDLRALGIEINDDNVGLVDTGNDETGFINNNGSTSGETVEHDVNGNIIGLAGLA